MFKNSCTKMKSKKATFSASYRIRKDKVKEGSAPLVLRIVVNGKKSEIAIKRKIPVDKWSESKKLIGSGPDVQSFNRYLDQLINKAYKTYETLMLNDNAITAEVLKNHILGIHEEYEQITLLYLMKYHNEQVAVTLEKGSLKHYFTTQRYLETFLQSKRKLSDIHIKNVDFKFLMDFELFLRGWKPKDHKKTMNHNGVMKHMCRFRKIINLAVKMEWLEKNPFKNYKIRYIKSERECLSIEELERIQEKDFGVDRINIVRDVFIFCCYTGLAHVDVANLSEDHLVMGMDGNQWISLKRQKTKNAFQVPLLPKALEIIDKYKDHPRSDSSKLLPVFSNQKVNGYLKEIATICGIKKNLTFHLARHTFATTITLANGVPIESVSKMLGHTAIATTQIYAKVLENKLSEDMGKLREKLSQTKLEKQSQGNTKESKAS
jgi:integrase/recombinase XerD